MSKRTGLTGVLTLGVVAVFVLWYLGFIWPSEGPLGGGIGGKFRAETGNLKNTVLFPLPQNKTEDDLVLESASLIGAKENELKLIGVYVVEGCATGKFCHQRFGFEEWPPKNVDLTPLDGYVLKAGEQHDIAVGVEFPQALPKNLEPGAHAHDSISVRGVVVHYRDGLRRHLTKVDASTTFTMSERGPKL